MGTDEDDHFKSVYKRQYGRAVTAKESGRVAIRDMKQDCYQKLFLGTDKIKFQTQAQKTFIDHRAKKTGLDAALEKDLRSHHWRLAHGNTHDHWKTVNQERLVDTSSVNTNNPLEAKRLLSELRKENFVIGHANDAHPSHEHDTYKNTIGKQAALNPEIAKDLRAHHFGEDMENEYLSTNK